MSSLKVGILFFKHTKLSCICVDNPGKGHFKGTFVGTAVNRVDVVCKADYLCIVSAAVLEGDLGR